MIKEYLIKAARANIKIAYDLAKDRHIDLALYGDSMRSTLSFKLSEFNEAYRLFIAKFFLRIGGLNADDLKPDQ